jgi:hypothetical protein
MLDNAFNNTIGGSGAARNVISGNAQNGIWMTGGAAFNAVQGNYIGTDATGAADLGNGHSGLWLEGATDNTIGGTGFGEENVISGNQLAGVAVTGGGARNLVRANRIGLNAAGTTAMGNSGDGVLLQDASYNMVGETGKGNNIAGNGGSGVYVSETAGSSLGNQVVGNAIGVTTSGAAAGNSGAGVYVGLGTDADVIGGLDPFSANLISANGGDGVFLAGINHQVLGNYIGTAPGGLTGMGNGGNGVSVVGINHDIGGSAAGAGNLIAFNVGAGIYGASGLNSNTLSRNRIHSNGSLGIEIDPAGVSGPKPELFFAAVGGGTTFISSGLTASPSTQYRIEYFHSVACDSSGFGEGQTYLGSFDVTTGPGGSVSFGPTLGTEAPAASFITATATDLFTGDTTEFSNCIPAFDDADDDDDGITDANEQGVTLTSPTNPDTDADAVIDGSDNCPLWPNTSQTLPPWPVPAGDSDCDGFTNAHEGTLGTVATKQCPVAGNPDAWPPDFNKSRSVSVTDVLAMKPYFGLTVPPAPARYDLVQSNSIGITDVLELKDYFGKSCT